MISKRNINRKKRLERKQKRMKYTVSVSIAVALLLVTTIGAGISSAATSPEQIPERTSVGSNGPAQIKEKDEIVYAALSAEGNAEAIYAVNHFELQTGGTVTDYGTYESVVNLTDSRDITQDGEAVTFSANKGNYYYQGNMKSTELPWRFNLSYSLDGQKMSPQEIAGKSGTLELKITSVQNSSTDPTFYENYMLQITVTLDTEKCTDIDAPGATVASAGADKAIAYTVLPGNDADFTLKADVTDFTMTGISVSAVPYSMSMEFPDIEGQLGELEQLPDVVAQLNEGAKELKSGTEKLKSGSAGLVDGSQSIEVGLAQLAGNAEQLTDASQQIDTALVQIASALQTGGEVDISQLAQLPQGLAELSNGLKAISGQIGTLKDGFAQAYGGLDAAMQGIKAAVSEEQIAALEAAVAGQEEEETANALIAQYRAAQTAKSVYDNVNAAFDGVNAALEQLPSSVETIAGMLDAVSAQAGSALEEMGGLEQLGMLTEGLTALSESYASFHSGLTGYLNGVRELASGYADFHAGLESFDGGVGELDDGVGAFSDGTEAMNNEMADLPDMIQEEIDKMKEEYMPSDFEPVSFTSPQNTDTDFVQFVLQSTGIEKQEEPEPTQNEEEPETFWDRLIALFQ